MYVLTVFMIVLCCNLMSVSVTLPKFLTWIANDLYQDYFSNFFVSHLSSQREIQFATITRE